MSHDFRTHGHQAFMAWSQSSLFINMVTVSNSSWEDFFLGLVNLLESYSLDINLDFPSATILFITSSCEISNFGLPTPLIAGRT